MTHTVLHIDASPRGADSVTRGLSLQVVDHLSPDSVIRRDVADGLPLLDVNWIGANFTPADARSDEQKAALALSDTLVGELQQADTIVIGLPVWNFGIPAVLKAWVDMIARAGVTFRYSENGPQGLLTGKRAILAVASGGTAVGSEIDFATTYMRHVLGFVGITEVEIVAADQLAIDAEATMKSAQEAIGQLAA
ncbi:MAG: FMN-dependent NADH-azoreductase [Paracoccaceae bacterium]